jgi:hypothetical protein
MTSSDLRASRWGALAAAGVLGLFALVAAPRAAYAQRSAADLESARQLYNQGLELRDRGDAQGALAKFRAAHALGNTPLTGLELCKMHASLDQPVEAREVCLGVGRIPPLAGETSRSDEARTEAARIADEMRAKLAAVRLEVTGVPQGREPTVVVDGAPVPTAALGELRAVNPGRHDIRVRIGRGPETRAIVELAPGERKIVALPVHAPPEDAAPPLASGPADPASPARARSNPLATAGFVVGGIGVGLGAVSGLVALSDKAELEGKCTDKICGAEDHAALDTARRWGNVSTAGFVVGAGGLLVGLIATLAAPRASSRGALPLAQSASGPRRVVTPDVGPAGVGVRGTF